MTRNCPYVSGIDAVGIAAESNSPLFIKPGDSVIVPRYDRGISHPGGFAGYIQVPVAWVVSMPGKMTTK